MRSVVSQERPSILWNPKVHYRVHNNPSLFPTLCHMNPLYTIASYILNAHSNIILPFTSVSSKWPLSLRVFPPNPACIFFPAIHATCPGQQRQGKSYVFFCCVIERVILCCKEKDNMLYIFRAFGKYVLHFSSKYFYFPFSHLKT